MFDLRNDGAVDVAQQPGHYSIHGEPPALRPISKVRADSTLAGSRVHELLVRPDGTRLLASDNGSSCESLPMLPDQPVLAGRTDGTLVYWGRDESGERHLVERTADAKWRVGPAIRSDAGLGVGLWDQGGRVVASYQSMHGGSGAEFGYYDEPTNQLRPIRRGITASNLQLVPGAAVDEPPTAHYVDGKKAVVDQPDPDLGYRRAELTLESSECSVPEVVDRNRRPTGNFRHQANTILFRTAGGGLWLAFTDAAGRCEYQLAHAPPPRADPFLLPRPPPPPPRWAVKHAVERASLVLVPVERGRFGKAKRVALPAIEPHYTGPWQFHPSVTSARVRLVIGSLAIDLDPNKLANEPPLAKPWVAPRAARVANVTVVPTPPPANAPPFPALRIGATATPLAMTLQGEHTISVPLYANNPNVKATCRVVTRVANDPKGPVERQLVMHCDQARALTMAADGARVAFTQFSQRGLEPIVEIDAGGNVVARVQTMRSDNSQIRFVRGAIAIGIRLPPNAPPTPPGWNIYEHDGTAVFGTSHARGYELLRGKVDRSNPNAPVWDWQPAFATGRTPSKGQLFWPVFLRRAGNDPTIVYVNDPRDVVDIAVRTRAGATIALPIWGRGQRGSYRVNELAAIEIAGEELPVIAAKIDTSIALAYPSSKATYAVRAIAGNESFVDLPPHSTGAKCSEAIVEREREELYSPQLFAWGKAAGLAYLSTRVRERLRWTVVPPGCGWVVDQRVVAKELAVARLDAHGATEVLRVPAEYQGATGFHGANLLVDKQGSMLHAIATSYGTTTYTRATLP